MTGCEVAGAVRSDDRTAGSLLVALTGYARPEDRRLAQAAGFA